MIFSKDLVGNSRIAQEQHKTVQADRDAYNTHTRAMNAMAGLNVNTGLIPRDVYQEMDNVTVERFRSDDGDVFTNDLLEDSRSVSIGKLVSIYRRASDAGNAQTSMTGQIGVKMDQTEYSYDGAIVPIHDAGFSRNFREFSAQSSEGFDSLIDDQRETTATIKEHLADNVLDGHKDKAGKLIVVDGYSFSGIRNDSRVSQIDIGTSGINFDFTDQAQTGAAIKAAFLQIRNVWWITNDVSADVTVYVSKEIAD